MGKIKSYILLIFYYSDSLQFRSVKLYSVKCLYQKSLFTEISCKDIAFFQQTFNGIQAKSVEQLNNIGIVNRG